MKNYAVLEGLIREAKGCLNNAFDKGYKQGCQSNEETIEYEVARRVSEEMEKEYKRGYEDGLALNRSEVDAAEACGMKRAWDVARKILSRHGEGYDATDREVFGTDDVFSLSASEAVAKLEAWEKKQDAPETEVGSIKVGDECICNCPNEQKVVVTAVLEHKDQEPWVTIMRKDGACYSRSSNGLTKTGNHYDIQSILDAMKG